MWFRVFHNSWNDGGQLRDSVELLRLVTAAQVQQWRNAFEADELLIVPGRNCCELYALNNAPAREVAADEAVPRQELELSRRLFRELGLPLSRNGIVTRHDQAAVENFLRSLLGRQQGECNDGDRPEVLRQALEHARELGTAGVLLNRLYQRALWLREKIRLETDCWERARSLAPALVEVAGKIFGEFQGCTALLIGCNQEAMDTAQELSRAGLTQLQVIPGNSPHLTSFVKTFPTVQIVSCNEKSLHELAPDLILIFEDSCPVVVSARMMGQFLARRNRAPLLLADLADAWPREKRLQKLYNLFYFDRNDLQQILDQELQDSETTDRTITQWIQSESRQFLEWAASDERLYFSSMVGRSPQMQKVFELVARLAHSDITVLIQGASGTGKELVARALHDESPRAAKPFVVVNCGAIPENLLESELFGHVRGAFTGAFNNKKGLFEEAEGGTIFLDEIGELSSALQVKLLRFLQEGEIKKVGSNSTVRLNVRVIAATNRNLQDMVSEGIFRSDLFYRLNVIEIPLPLLKERRDDIPVLAMHFVHKYVVRMKKTVAEITAEAMTRLMDYHWPGNVRELENVMERAVALCAGRRIGPTDLPEFIRKQSNSLSPPPERPSLKEVERRHIVETLEYCSGNHDETARVLGIGRTTLWRKLKEYRLAEEDEA